MADRRAHSVGVRETPGVVDDDRPCADCPDDGNSAVYRVPDPRYSVATTAALCGYHLAVLKREHPKYWADLTRRPECADLEGHVPAHALVERADLPATITLEDTEYSRVGLDQLGSGYYAHQRVDAQLRVVAVDETYTIQSATRIPPAQFPAFLEYIETTRGWRGLEGEWLDFAAEVKR